MARKQVRHPVVLVHGVCSDGAWQEELAPLLAQFFEPIRVKYPQYGGPLGGLCVFMEPWIVVLVMAIMTACYTLKLLPGWYAATAALVACAFAVLPASVDFRCRLALKAYTRATRDCFQKVPHLIAHSFGTYLSARLMTELPVARFRRVILCGCVLPSHFDWYAQLRAGHVEQVRNDFSAGDKVGWIARLAGLVHDNLGHSGTVGMDRQLQKVHRLPKPDAMCPACQQDRVVGAIHDVDCSGMGHSDAFLDRAHCRRWWLPFLWGIDPAEHWTLLEMCRLWREASSNSDWPTLAAIEQGLRAERRHWCFRESVWTRLERALHDARLASDAESVIFTFDQMAGYVERARMSSHDEPDVIYLHPHYAIAAALGRGGVVPP